MRENNAKKLWQEGIFSAYRKGKYIFETPRDAFVWRRGSYDTKVDAETAIQKLREEGFVDPLAFLPDAHQGKGFFYIRGLKSGAGYVIKRTSPLGGWVTIGKYDSSEAAQAAYDELLKDPMVLEG